MPKEYYTKLNEVVEIWMVVDEGGEAYSIDKQKNLKRVAILINGYPIKLDEGFMLEKRQIIQQEAESYTKALETLTLENHE